VYRTLRFQLIAIVVATVASVLAMSQWVDTIFSERALERDIKERGLLILSTVDSLWSRSDADTLAHKLATLVEGSRDVLAIDVYRLDSKVFELALTTRGAESPPVIDAAQMAQLVRDGILTARVRGPDGADIWRLAMPLQRAGTVVGAAQVDVSLAEAASLKRGLRTIDAVFLVLSIAFLSLALAFFLERRVARPVAALVGGMQRAETGALGARVAFQGRGEFAFLASSFNSMLSRIEDLTAGLESRVRRATRDLADKNRELAEANEKLWRARLELGRSERLAALGQMAATIAHELGTPLNSILGYTQLLLREDLLPEHGAMLTIVESQVQRMIETIRSVLDRTRERQRAPVALQPLVTEVLGLVSTRLVGRELVALNEVPTTLPPVPGDVAGLRQALLNLLTNAIDATDPPGTIAVSGAEVSGNGRGGRYVELAVRDTGHGMAPEELRRVFEPFYTTKAPGRGTGLGLAIVDHIVRAHNGHVVAESAPGEGTTMRILLPLEV
jgi:two-component system, NtrC family, sensor kinase